MFCQHCGKPLPEEGAFCAHCGKPIRENSRERASAGGIGAAVKTHIAKLTYHDYLIHGLQLLATVLALFFPMVQEMLFGELDWKLRGIFRKWSYINKQYNYEERRELLHNNLQLVAVLFLFVILILIGVAIFRQRRNICAIGSTAAYVVYGIIVLRMVGNGYYKRPSHEDFMLTAEFWIGLVLMLLALVVTLGLHKKILQYLRKKVNK